MITLLSKLIPNGRFVGVLYSFMERVYPDLKLDLDIIDRVVTSRIYSSRTCTFIGS